MARGKKTSSEIKAKVIEAKINNPDLSSRQIKEAMEGEVSNDTICDIINKDLPQVATQSHLIANLINTNNNLQSSADALIAEMIANKDDRITLAQLTSLRDSTFKQNEVLGIKSDPNSKREIIITI